MCVHVCLDVNKCTCVSDCMYLYKVTVINRCWQNWVHKSMEDSKMIRAKIVINRFNFHICTQGQKYVFWSRIIFKRFCQYHVLRVNFCRCRNSTFQLINENQYGAFEAALDSCLRLSGGEDVHSGKDAIKLRHSVQLCVPQHYMCCYMCTSAGVIWLFHNLKFVQDFYYFASVLFWLFIVFIYLFYLFILSIHRVDSPFSTKLIFKGVHYSINLLFSYVA